jgi:ABC-type polysaccharide/polyol phosphate transport system ATPase subunit
MSSQKLFESENATAIEITGVSKEFYLNRKSPRSLRELFIATTRRERNNKHPGFSLKELSLTITKGEIVALIGSNGSGKSCLLRMIAGIYRPTTGQIKITGKMGTVIELGAGFSPELTGEENIILYGLMLGLSKQDINNNLTSIVEFAELNEFIDVPVKYYSSGMLARLAFSIALSNQPEILLLDEVLAVGDASFRKKCWERLFAYKKANGTLLVVTHDPDTIKGFCDKVFWLEKGTLQMEGEPELVIKNYQDFISGQ